ncbi:MAG: cysteine synthase A [Eubacteriales bacterium]|nr:cysteine synthase A [Eubacteriales bacterium]MDY3332233.1 cysteine synthase A [Gallibacter sp.]
MKILNGILETIGNTPLIRLPKYSEESGANIYVKLEKMNPTSSIKDRAAYEMIRTAEGEGVLKEGATIIEPTSGNTGVGIAMISAARGYKSIIVMPDTMSIERRQLMSAFGAEVVLTPGSEGMAGALKKAEELNKEIEGSWIAGQFSNTNNAKAHYKTTGPEIFEALDGKVDILVAGIGTGGTITGIGQYLKEKKADVRVVGVEPAASPLLTKGEAGAHKIQGIGANFIPDILNKNVLDDVIVVENDDAINQTVEMAKTEGLLCGISSGAALYAGRQLASLPENKDRNIIVILPDTGERYLSTGIF